MGARAAVWNREVTLGPEAMSCQYQHQSNPSYWDFQPLDFYVRNQFLAYLGHCYFGGFVIHRLAKSDEKGT